MAREMTVSKAAIKIHAILAEMEPDERERVFDAIDIINEIKNTGAKRGPKPGRKRKAKTEAEGDAAPAVVDDVAADNAVLGLKKDGTPRKKPGPKPKVVQAETPPEGEPPAEPAEPEAPAEPEPTQDEPADLVEA